MRERDLIKRINYLGLGVGGAAHLIDLEPYDLMDCAMKSTGLSDFGKGEWKSNYYSLLEGIKGNNNINTLGRLLLKANILRTLRNILLLENELKINKSVELEDVTNPIFIVGLFRSGTSIMQEILAQDHRLRSPMAWEASCPVPSVDVQITQHQIAESCNEILMDIEPELEFIHELRWNLPVECAHVLSEVYFPAPLMEGTIDKIDETNPQELYSMHKRVLQWLQYRGEKKRWVLKAPMHLLYLNYLFDTYPKAIIINMLRDPIKCVPSSCNFHNVMTSSYGRRCKKSEFKDVANCLEKIVRKSIDVRRSGLVDNSRILDVYYLDFVKNPWLVMEKIYGFIDIKYSEDISKRAINYMYEKRKRISGRSRYSPERFGLSTREIREKFEIYTSYYQIPLE